MATGRMSDDLENPNLCKHRACDTVIGTEPADLPLRPAVIEPREEAGEMTATDHRAKTKKSSCQAGVVGDEGVDGVGSQASACGKVDIRIHSKGVTLMPALIIGLDLAKHVFQVHGTDQNGEVVLRKKLRRSEMVESSGNCPVVSLAWKRVAPRTTGVGC